MSTTEGLTAPVKTTNYAQQILKDRTMTPRERAERATTYLIYTLCVDMGIVPPSLEELQEAYS